MEPMFFYKNMSTQEQEALQEYVFKKLPRLEKLLTNVAPDGIKLHITCEKFDKHSAYEVEMILHIPSQKLVAKETSHAITKAVDLATDRLEMQLKKNVETLRRSHRNLKMRRSLKHQVLALEQLPL